MLCVPRVIRVRPREECRQHVWKKKKVFKQILPQFSSMIDVTSAYDLFITFGVQSNYQENVAKT